MRYVSVCTATGSLCCQNTTNAHGPNHRLARSADSSQNKMTTSKNKSRWVKVFFSEYYDETSYSSWKRISLNKHITIIDHVGRIYTQILSHCLKIQLISSTVSNMSIWTLRCF